MLLVGFASYADAIDAMLEPTTERAGARAAVAGLRAEGGTATGDALDAALDRLEAVRAQGGRTAPAAIVLLSDGATTTGSDPARAAARAKRLRIPVHTVALGTADGVVPGPQGEPIPVPPDRATLATIARDSGGQAFEVADAGALERVYRDLGSGIATRKERREVTAAFAAGGLVLLLVGAGTALRGRPRIF